MLVFTKADTEDTSYQLFMIYRHPYSVLLLNLKEADWLALSCDQALLLIQAESWGLYIETADFWLDILIWLDTPSIYISSMATTSS